MNDISAIRADTISGPIDDGAALSLLSQSTPVAAASHRAKAEPFGNLQGNNLEAIITHLQRISGSRASPSKSIINLLLSETLFQETKDAILLCDAGRQVMHLNRAARHLSPACGSIGHDGRFSFKSDTAQASFILATDQAAHQRITTVFEVPRKGKLPYRVEVRSAWAETATIVTNILDTERKLQHRIECAQHMYHFTPSECALAESLLRGRSPEEHAMLRGTSLSTVRSQLHIMFAKSRTRRQSELIAHISQSA